MPKSRLITPEKSWAGRMAKRITSEMPREERRRLMPKCAEIVDEYTEAFGRLKEIDCSENGWTFHWEARK